MKRTGEDPPTRKLGWRPDLLVPKTTVWLPLVDYRPLDTVGKEHADRLLGPDAPKKQRRALAEVIRGGTLDSRHRGANLGALIFFPDLTRIPPVANLDVFCFYPKPPNDPLTLDYYRRIYGTPEGDTIGEIEVSEVDLPPGPAVRIHRHRAQEPDHLGQSIEREDVIYAVRPPQIPDAVVLVVSWVELALGPALIKTADAVAKTLAIKPLDDPPA
jgi:hypothetical protein